MSAGSSGGWYAGLTKRRVYERFVLSFCLRVDDEFTFGGDAHGVLAYATENDGRVPARASWVEASGVGCERARHS